MLSSPRLATWRNKPKFQQLFLHLPPSQKRSSKIYCTRKRLSREQRKTSKLIHLTPGVMCYLICFHFGALLEIGPAPESELPQKEREKKASTIDELQSERNRIRSRARRRNSCFRTIRHEKQRRKKKKLDENFSYSYYTRVAHVQAHTHTHSCNTKSWREIRRLGLSIFNELLNVA